MLTDVPRLVLTLLSIISTYALLTGMGLSMSSYVDDSGILNRGLPGYVALVLPPIVQFSFAATMYMLFVASIAERKNQYRLMCSAGCTTRQLLWGFLTESFVLDFVGGVPGIGLGFLIARLQLGALGIPLRTAAYFGTKQSLLGLLPLIMLVPLMLLAASIQLWVPPRDKKRRMQRRKDRLPFQKRFFSRCFGAGGILERALGKNERRHHATVLFSVVANLSVLFLLTAGVSMGAVMRRTDAGEHTVYLLCENPTEETSALLENTLLPLRRKELCGSYSFSHRAEGLYAEIYGDDPAALLAALEQELVQARCFLSFRQFGDGFTTATPQEQEAAARGETVVRIMDGASNADSFNVFLEQTEQFFLRYFTVMIFLSIGLNMVNIVHINRLSRRREYAILTSIGMSGRQRLGMLLYESFRFTFQVVFCGVIVILLLARFIGPSVEKAFDTESVSLSQEFLGQGWETPYQQIMTTIGNMGVALKPYWPIMLFTLLFLFFGYLLTELSVNRKMNRDELIPILKDDMHE